MRHVPPQVPRPAPPEIVVSPRLAALAAELRAGRAEALEGFWAAVTAEGTPLVEEIPGDPVHRAVTFLWRGDADDVLVMANKLNDPSVLEASLMERLGGTDVWHRTYRVGSAWRASYRLAPGGREGSRTDAAEDRPGPGAGAAEARPVTDVKDRTGTDAGTGTQGRTGTDAGTDAGTAGLASSVPLGGEVARRRDAMIAAGSRVPRAAIERWCLGLARAIADPLNPRSWRGYSVAEMPDAPPQHALAPRRSRREPTRHVIGGRTVWRYDPARPSAATLVLLDGEDWTGDAPVILGNLIEAGAVPPLTAFLVESGGHRARTRDLTCDDGFVSFLADELPTGEHPPSRTAIAGQSLGGLTALYAAYRRPDRFGAAISQSGSFWWPNQSGGPGEPGGAGGPGSSGGPDPSGGSRGSHGEWLTAELARASRVPARCHVEVGTQEWALLGPTRRLRDVLRAGGCDLTYREYEGGHDGACWRGSLADGLVAVFRGTS
ncbi:enterochelin esterase family protein [Streptosporangium becharense]|uniref:Enterochelin esterase family protein n=1 Tax=Streptosporangium becharense TaxID=1816182 RepID=A0A7W9MG06_9ACTN|nr:enterochelin esterase domain-containing protein [Streptosporangium becharense]MBB2912316.1 enterochelin esterase family protein [Streptosporangium becharense]MBB5818863.1 enterochelin esterase family protein [Streptosporangium becharense]